MKYEQYFWNKLRERDCQVVRNSSCVFCSCYLLPSLHHQTNPFFLWIQVILWGLWRVFLNSLRWMLRTLLKNWKWLLREGSKINGRIPALVFWREESELFMNLPGRIPWNMLLERRENQESWGGWGGQYPEQLSSLNCCASLSLPSADNRLHWKWHHLLQHWLVR